MKPLSGKRYFTQFVAIVTAASVLLSAGAPFAQCSSLPEIRQDSFWQQRSKAYSSSATSSDFRQFLSVVGKKSVPPFDLPISKDVASVVEVWQAQDSVYPLVILVQDAHGHAAAQKNIAELLQAISKRQPSRPISVFVEGSWGKVSPEWLCVLPQSVRVAAAQRLLESGRLMGEEYFAMTQGADKITIEGIEDKKAYAADLLCRQTVNLGRQALLGRLDILARRAQAVKPKIYSFDLMQADHQKKSGIKNSV